MVESARQYTTEEVMAAATSKELKDGEVGFTGLATGTRTATLIVGIPLVAMGLAQHTHAPNFTIMCAGWLLNPKLDEIPTIESEFDCRLLSWKCEARICDDENITYMARRGDIDVGFCSAAQIDKYGNINSVCIGDYSKPKVRLVGAIFQTEHMSIFNREIVMIDHERRNFVEKVDFISGVGYLNGPGARERAGLKRGGPSKVVTNMAILDFDPVTKRMRVESVHPGFTIDDVRRNTGFELLAPERVPETPPPTAEEIRLIREKIDPQGILIPR
jgi:glutaconate CoA-transferase subunit B